MLKRHLLAGRDESRTRPARHGAIGHRGTETQRKPNDSLCLGVSVAHFSASRSPWNKFCHGLRGLAVIISTGVVAGTLAASGISTAGETDPHQLVSDDPTGQMRTFDVNGALDVDNPFFKDLGTNGRTCFSCHRPAQGWTITPESVQDRFAESRGLDPIFRTNDGSNCEGADVSTVGKRQAAFSLLLTRGLIRVGIDVPIGAEFVIDSVDDPYRCGARSADAAMYRRPLPSTNL